MALRFKLGFRFRNSLSLTIGILLQSQLPSHNSLDFSFISHISTEVPQKNYVIPM